MRMKKVLLAIVTSLFMGFIGMVIGVFLMRPLEGLVLHLLLFFQLSL